MQLSEELVQVLNRSPAMMALDEKCLPIALQSLHAQRVENAHIECTTAVADVYRDLALHYMKCTISPCASMDSQFTPQKLRDLAKTSSYLAYRLYRLLPLHSHAHQFMNDVLRVGLMGMVARVHEDLASWLNACYSHYCHPGESEHHWNEILIDRLFDAWKTLLAWPNSQEDFDRITHCVDELRHKQSIYEPLYVANFSADEVDEAILELVAWYQLVAATDCVNRAFNKGASEEVFEKLLSKFEAGVMALDRAGLKTYFETFSMMKCGVEFLLTARL